ncbi:type IV secretion system protein [Lonepinella sp. BR2882]|uniref:type IV secretion system protein n=1 Tax=Lonepinella sp. BR2882 TaxID=3095283 RepID=UPI003F6DDBE1
MAGTLIGDVYKEITTPFESNVTSYAQSIGDAVKPLFGACLMLYVVFLVYKLYTKKDFLAEEIINALILFSVISAFIFGGTMYYSKVIPFVTGAGDQIAAAISGNSGTSINAVDTTYNAFEKGFDVIKKQWAEADGIKDSLIAIGDLAAPAICLFIAQLIFSVFITINLILAKIMVVLLLSVGVIFFCFAAFPATRGMFSSFVGLCFNYILLNVLYSIAAKLASDQVVAHLGTGDKVIANAAYILIATFIIVLSINQIPTLLSSLTGGVGISAFTVSGTGLKNNAARALGLAGKGAKAAGKGSYIAGNYASKGGLDKATGAAKAWKDRAVGAVKDNYNSRVGKGSASS